METSVKLGIVIASSLFTTVATSQENLPLGSIGQTDLQQRMGNAVQTVCMGFLGSSRAPTSPQQLDLFSRCGEMVHTANRILGSVNAPTSKDLGVNKATLASYLQQVAGEEAAAQSNVVTEAMMGQSVVVADRLSSFMNTMSGIARVNHNYTGGSQDFNALGIGASSDALIQNQRWGVFGSLKSGMGDKDTTDREDGFELDDYQVLVGVDYIFNDHFVGGIAYGYRDVDADYDVSQRVPGAQMDVSTDTFTLYSLYQRDEFYFSTVLDIGSSEFDSSRNVQIISSVTDNSGAPDRILRSSTESTQYALSLEAGYQLVNDNRIISPYFKVRYLDMEIDEFAEQDSSETSTGGGGLALAYQEQNVESLKTALGGQISWTLNRDFGVLTPYLMAEWLYEHEDESRAITAQYVYDPQNNLIEFITDEPDSNYFNLGAGVSVVFPNGIQAFVDANTTVGLEDFTYTNFTAGVRMAF
ncbi:autotransporter outer membrane beta-barrel domain-containing protein [Alteromonas sp. ASW11-130]|uniref:autotransporter outer membrane beta-barrel domain-containing protein n=1 Tax=Alteromonas sp. ASW11-130 TaxID=3015775 RepID=UPI00224256AC|nr:autotransporter outer membrane beta-barrel domain-containing protein [Alteromonas sp. ASW11-130]MCW8091157.1 autotransporter outer membrane beta-barrel domain-containing protein [Alteromonas sp. ASW11-130]